MGWTSDLLDGIAADLDAAGIGTWDPDGATGNIERGALSDEHGNGIGLQAYNTQPDHASSDVVQPVQFWIRGDDQFVADTADAIFDRYEGAVNLTFGGIVCPLVALNSDVPMGVDGRGRRERAVNYYFTASRPTASRPD